MNGEERRNQIVDILKHSSSPVPGTQLAQILDVSRQVIVQDIALIRAKNIDVFSTNRGYVLNDKQEYSRILKVKHEDDEVEAELGAIVDMGGWIRDVFVYHKVYGVIRAEMNIHSRRDIRKYLEEIANGKSSLLMKMMRRTRKRPGRMLLFLRKNWKPRRKKRTRHLKPCSM